MTTKPHTDHPGISQPFILYNGAVRGRLVRLNGVAEAILSRHRYPDPVSRVVAEAMAAAATLADSLKFEGSFTLQIQGDGPVHTIVTDITSEREMRACAQFNSDSLDQLNALPDVQLPRLVGNGHIAFTVDQGAESDRYQGIVELDGANLGDCIHQYFRKSEQLETAIKIAAAPDPLNDDAHHWQASAIMVQRMPPSTEMALAEVDDDAWRSAVILLSSVTDDELLDPKLSEEDILSRLFGTVGGRLLNSHSLSVGCRCSRERSANILASFPMDEVRNMAVDGTVTMTCEFCEIGFDFSDSDLTAIQDKHAAHISP